MNAELIIPEHFVIDEVVRDQMERSLARAPAQVAGIVAETGPLPAGSSYRVHAEWRSLEFPSDVRVSTTTDVRSAVLIRPGVTFEWQGDILEVDGPLLVDRGAHVHDVRRDPGPLEVASELGQPPFPRRPIVVFVACRPDPGLGDWARGLVNDLLPRDVEGRLALAELPPGVHLTRPCLPCAASIRALSPDIVVALDATAVADVGAWCTDRKTVIIELASDPQAQTELVSWQVGQASGRLRARIGRGVAAPDLARLVLRLCAGPQPMPPSDAGAVAVAKRGNPVHAPTARRPASASVVIVTGAADGQLSTRGRALLDHLDAAGITVETQALRSARIETLDEAELVLLTAIAGDETAEGLIARRGTKGMATVLDLLPADLALDVPTAGVPTLAPRMAALAARCGLVTTPDGAIRDAARDLGVRAHVLPTLPGRARADALKQAYTERPSGPPERPIVGWHIGSPPARRPSYLDAVASGLASLLEQRQSVHVHVVGESSAIPPALKDHNRVSATGDLRAGTLAMWSVHVWTPGLLNNLIADDPLDVVEASHAGVPTLMPAPGRAAIDGSVAPELVVQEFESPDAWAASLQRLIDAERTRSMLARHEALRSHTVYGAVAAQAAMQRFVGWATYRAAG